MLLTGPVRRIIQGSGRTFQTPVRTGVFRPVPRTILVCAEVRRFVHVLLSDSRTQRTNITHRIPVVSASFNHTRSCATDSEALQIREPVQYKCKDGPWPSVTFCLFSFLFHFQSFSDALHLLKKSFHNMEPLYLWDGVLIKWDRIGYRSPKVQNLFNIAVFRWFFLPRTGDRVYRG